MDRLFLAGFIVALAAATWWLALRNDDLRDQVESAETRIKTIKRSQEISDDIHSLDDGVLGAELHRRLSRPISE